MHDCNVTLKIKNKIEILGLNSVNKTYMTIFYNSITPCSQNLRSFESLLVKKLPDYSVTLSGGPNLAKSGILSWPFFHQILATSPEILPGPRHYVELIRKNCFIKKCAFLIDHTAWLLHDWGTVLVRSTMLLPGRLAQKLKRLQI